jgi:DNA-binding transcriptional LysR family regulator
MGIELAARPAGRKLNDGIAVIRAMNFAALDLNLLRVFDAMMLELSTVRAGERIGLSQPAVSSALGRLRQLLGDELFVRDGNRMVPTPRAVQLNEPIQAALRQIEQALTTVTRFEPATARQSFIILGSDYFSTLLMPRLARAIVPEAPGVTVQMLDRPSGELLRLLSEGFTDAAVDRELDVPDWIGRKTLFRSYMLCVAAKGHPVLTEHHIDPGCRIPAEVFCRIPQVLMSMDGGRIGTIDETLKEHGLTRTVAMTVPHFQAVALAAASSPLLGSLPVHFARHAAMTLGLDLYLPPYDPPQLDVCLYWHRRLDRDAANIWLRGHILRTLEFDAQAPSPTAPRTDGKPWSL